LIFDVEARGNERDERSKHGERREWWERKRFLYKSKCKIKATTTARISKKEKRRELMAYINTTLRAQLK